MARYLIDTQIFFWAVEGSARLSPAEAAVLTDPHIDIVVSVVSIWELSIKWALGRFEIAGGQRAIPANHFARSAATMGVPILPVEPPEAEYVRQMPLIHRDPFDRLLIAQALLSGRIMISRDAIFARYPGVQLFMPS